MSFWREDWRKVKLDRLLSTFHLLLVLSIAAMFAVVTGKWIYGVYIAGPMLAVRLASQFISKNFSELTKARFVLCIGLAGLFALLYLDSQAANDVSSEERIMGLTHKTFVTVIFFAFVIGAKTVQIIKITRLDDKNRAHTT